MIELKPCPFHNCLTCACVEVDMTVKDWNTRPIEDALHARIAELEVFIDRLIEEGDALESQVYVVWRKYGMLDFPAAETWCVLVKDWKERER